MAFTGVAALIGAIGEGAAITAGMVLSAVAEVGTALTVVGAVTGNKDMMKVGGVMGLVGGVGGLLSSAVGSGGAVAGAASTADALAPPAIDAGVDGATQAGITSAGDALSDVASTGTESLGNPTDLRLAAGTQGTPMDAAAGGAGGMDASMFAPGDASAGQTSMPQAPDTSPAGQTAAAQPIPGVADVTTPGGAVSTTPTSTSSITNPTDARLAAGMQASPLGGSLTAPIDSQSYLQKMMSYMQDPRNKTVLQLGEKLVGGALQGMQSQSQFNAKLDLENRRLAQTSYGSQVGQNRPRGGIIAGARQ